MLGSRFGERGKYSKDSFVCFYRNRNLELTNERLHAGEATEQIGYRQNTHREIREMGTKKRRTRWAAFDVTTCQFLFSNQTAHGLLLYFWFSSSPSSLFVSPSDRTAVARCRCRSWLSYHVQRVWNIFSGRETPLVLLTRVSRLISAARGALFSCLRQSHIYSGIRHVANYLSIASRCPWSGTTLAATPSSDLVLPQRSSQSPSSFSLGKWGALSATLSADWPES